MVIDLEAHPLAIVIMVDKSGVKLGALVIHGGCRAGVNHSEDIWRETVESCSRRIFVSTLTQLKSK